MIRTVETPKRPHFIFDGKMWEIENKFTSVSGERQRTKVKFEHICETMMIDQDKGFNSGEPVGSHWSYVETVTVQFDDDYDDPEITLYILNRGTIVSQGKKNKIENLTLPFFVVQKLVKEASKIDAKNRDK
jgi:hypothetical protein